MLLAPLVAAFPMLAAGDGTAVPKAFVEGHRTLYTLRATDQFGMRVQPLPDLNADGIGDVAFGAHSLESDSSSVLTSGDVSIYSGLDGRRLHELSAIGSTTLFPDALADAGDMDRDGTHDLAVGTTSSAADGHRGTVSVFSGRDGRMLRRLTGEIARQRYGDALATLPDRTGDGVPEL